MSITKEERFVIFIMGPTASGKTDLAVDLFNEINAEIISVDSALVYKGMDIGTAKPDVETLKQAPHHLIDICEPAESYSAANFCDDAKKLIKEIFARNRIPILVGGTGLYFRALEKGLSSLPQANPRVRQRLEIKAKEIGWPAMHEILQQVDPDAAKRIQPNDPQRIQRALEVYEITGKSMTYLHNEHEAQAFEYPVKKFILAPENRAVLHDRIKLRFSQMLEDGLVEEVEGFFNNPGLNSSLPSMRMVGYRQVWQHLAGELEFEEMVERGVIATRQLAKRQITWCRSEENAEWLNSEEKMNLEKILKSV